jgi:putative hydrolase of HD superfamily
MLSKADIPITLLKTRPSVPLVEAYFEFTQLKQLYRQGWLRRGVPTARCESVAEHTFSMAVLAMIIADASFPDLDLLKVLRLVLLHDFGEIYAGDIVPADGVEVQEKHRRERESVLQVLSKLPNGAAYVALWAEYEASSSSEARFVKQIDRLDMGLQASVYEQQGMIDSSEFLTSVEAVLTAPELQPILAELRSLAAKE